MKFSDIPGHQEIKKYLVSAHKNNRIAHAQLFSGVSGSANLPLALAFSNYIMCQQKEADDSCGSCPNCLRMAKLIHPDLHFFYPKPSAKPKEYDKALSDSLKKWREMVSGNFFPDLNDWITINGFESKNLLISKEDSKQIIKTVSMKSFEGGYKIVFIWYPEFMHQAAANAILKILEEPPTNTIYFLITYAYENLLTTITSRTQLISVPPFTEEEIEDYLIDIRGIEVEKARNVALLANGSMSNAFRELDQAGEIAYQEFQEWMRNCLKRNYSELVRQSEAFGQRSRSDQKSHLEYSLALVRESTRSVISGGMIDGRSPDEVKFITNFGKANTLGSMERIHFFLSEALSNLERNANPRITYLNLSLNFCNILEQR